MYDSVCQCRQICSCYWTDRRVVAMRMEYIEDEKKYDDKGLIIAGGICIVEYETGELQRLKRVWMDLCPQWEYAINI